jgi:hypothetical protein
VREGSSIADHGGQHGVVSRRRRILRINFFDINGHNFSLVKPGVGATIAQTGNGTGEAPRELNQPFGGIKKGRFIWPHRLIVKRGTIMARMRVRPPPSVESEQHFSSSPCFLHQSESDFGYWTREEELAFLNDLLKLERKGTKALADVGRAAKLPVADLVLEAELLQASFSVFLRKEIEARGGKASSPAKQSVADFDDRPDLAEAVALAISNQQELVDAIRDALLKLFDPQLRVTLLDMQKLHRLNIDHLKSLPGAGPPAARRDAASHR